jgi:DNA invertase Pin-like site-specific DNA recombinase
MFQMLGVFAEFERSIIAERVRAGLCGSGLRANALVGLRHRRTQRRLRSPELRLDILQVLGLSRMCVI